MLTAAQLAKALGGKRVGARYMARCPAHADRTPSLSIQDGTQATVFHCHAGCTQENVLKALHKIGLREQLFDCSRPSNLRAPKKQLASKPISETWVPLPFQPPELPAPSEASRRQLPLPWLRTLPSATWAYRTAAGHIAGFAYRFDDAKGKKVLPLTPCRSSKGTFSWRWVPMAKPRPLYRLPELLRRPNAPIIIAEGEKTADAAQILFPECEATTPAGAGQAAAHTDWSPVKGRLVIIFADNDAPGQKRAAEAARLCHIAEATHVLLAIWPSDIAIDRNDAGEAKPANRQTPLPLAWDLADALAEGWTPDAVRRWVVPKIRFNLVPKSAFPIATAA